MVRLVAGAAFLVMTANLAMAQDEEHYAQARLACLSDAVRLCGAEMYDLDQVRECMKDKKKLVSPGCAAFYPGGKRAGEVQ